MYEEGKLAFQTRAQNNEGMKVVKQEAAVLTKPTNHRRFIFFSSLQRRITIPHRR
jgi:hypothetical protein